MDQPKTTRPIDIAHSSDFAAWLKERRAAIALSTGVAGRLVMLGLDKNGAVSVFLRRFDAAHGLHAAGQTLLMATGYQIWRLENTVGPGQDADGHDRLYAPRLAYTIGDVKTGDVAFAADGTVLFANTQFNCIAAASAEYNFIPIWRPPFISRLTPEDRCHLTGFALEDGLIRYVAMAAASDQAGAWAPRLGDGGLVIDAATDATLATGLAMPCSPRLENGRLWLNEGVSGMFGFVRLDDGTFEEVAFCPGFLSGLDFIDGFAVVATSVTRGGRSPAGLPLERNLHDYRATAQTAVCVVDLGTGEVAHWLRLEGFSEIRDVAVLRDTVRPAALGLIGQDVRRVLSIGPDRSQRQQQRNDAA